MPELDCLRRPLFFPLLGLLCLGLGLFGTVPLHAQVVDFEDGTIPSDWTEPGSSDAPWSITSATSGSGTYSIVSGNTTNDQTSEIQVTIDVPVDSVITFDYRVSSESCCDELRFYIDGTNVFQDAGDTGWLSSGEISVSAGTHTFRWAYEKDLSVSENADSAWVDNVALPGLPQPPASLTAQAVSGSDVQLDWSSVSNAAEYVVYRETAPIDSSAGPSSSVALDTVSAGTTTYTDGSGASGTTYYYRVTGVDANDKESGFSEQASVTPGHAATATQPRSGTPGTTLQIYGKGFDPTASNNSVSFIDQGGTATSATVTAAQPSVLTVEVPNLSASTQRVEVVTGTKRDTVGTAVQVLAENTGTRTFAATSLTGVSQSDAAWGDYDNDGDKDVVIAGGGTTTLYVNDGSGSFSAANESLSGVGSGASVAWGDYNGDDHLDLVVTGSISGTPSATIYKNDGAGSLNSISAGIDGVNVGDAAWGDYDNDGDLDLVIMGEDGSGITITKLYRNDGGGTFTSVSDNLDDLRDGTATWADYNNDGFLDLAIAGIDGASTRLAQVYRGDGDSTFTAVGSELVDVSSGTIRWGDYDQDQDLDLLVSGDDAGVPTTELYRNDGGDTFTAVSAGLVDARNSTVDWGDYDGDGDPDLVLSGKAGSDTTAVLYRNDGSGDFTAINAGLTGVTNGSVGWADQNGDGVLDLVVTGTDASNTASARVYESTSAPPPPPSGLAATAFADSVQLGWNAVGASDLTEYRIYRNTAPIDSTADIGSATALDTVSAGTTTYTDASITTGTTYYYRVTAADDMGSESGSSNQASGTPAFRLSGFEPVSGTPTTAVRVFGNGFSSSGNTVTFLNGAGTDQPATVSSTQDYALTVEVPSGLSGPTRIEVVRNDGETDTTTARFTPVGTGIGDRSFASISTSIDNVQKGEADWGDYDQDGDVDLAISGRNSSSTLVTKVYRNDGGGTFAEVASLTGVLNGVVKWGDYDQDGDLDLFVAGDNNGGSSGGQTATIYENEGSGTFTAIGAGLTGASFAAAAWGDYDGDGDLDLIAGGLASDSNTDQTTILYRNEGNNTFTPVGAGLPGISRGAFDWGDYDGDGDLDLILSGFVTDTDRTTAIYRNEGSGTFTAIGANLTDVGASAVDWGDYNGDGNLDLVVTGENNTGDAVATIYENDGTGTFSSLGAGLRGVVTGDANWSDYDGDSDLDLVMSGAKAVGGEPLSRIYRNDGGSTFTVLKAGLADVVTGVSEWGDYDGNGALDLVLTGTGESGSPFTAIYRSRAQPIIPDSLRAPAAFADSVRLRWDRVDVTDLDKYRIYRDTAPIDSSAGPSGTTATLLDSTSAGTTAFTDTTVTPGTTYYYRVTAVDNSGAESSFSNQDVATPVFRLTNFSPTSGVPGDSVRVYGNGFTTSLNAVAFLDPSGTTTSAIPGTVTPTALTVGVPSGVGGPARIIVERSDGARDTTAARFTPIGTGIGDRSFDLVDTAPIDSVQNSDVAWGDYDDDGDLDLAIAGGTSSGNFASAAIYRNDGGGSFVNIGAGLTAIEFHATLDWGDYDNDGDLDLVIAGEDASGTPVTEIYRNDGSDTFNPVGAGLPGITAGTVRWGDYNGDGKPDLLIAGQDQNDDRLSRIYRNDGNGRFVSIEAGLTNLSATAADWGDFDNDGDLDLLLAGSDGFNPQTILYRNNGGGTFTPVGTGLTGLQDGEVAWGDYNNDGNLDLVFAGRESISSFDLLTTVYRNNGDGTFTSLDAGLTDVYQGGADWGDYDGDGDLDLIVSGAGEGSGEYVTTIYRNDGGGTFTPLKQNLEGGVSKGSADWVDYDGNGTLDLFLTGGSFTSAVTNLYQSQPEPNPPTRLTATARSDSVALDWEATTAGDLQEYRIYRDTAPIDSSAGPSSLTALATVGANTTSYADASVTAGDTLYYRVTALDTTGVESGFSNGDTGTPGFRLAGISPTRGTPGTPVRVSGNGFDLTASSNTVSFLDTTGTVTSATVTAADTTALTAAVPNGLEGPARIAVERSDGSSDTTATRFTPIGPNIGDRSFMDTGFSFTGTEESDAAWADYDNDGDLDVVITGDGPTTTLYRNDDSTFTAVGAGLTDVGNSDVAWADYDNDGDPDLALMGGGSGPTVTEVYENKGGGTFDPVGLGLLGIENGGIDWGDFNGDGRPDLAVTGQDGVEFSATTKVYRNENDTTFTAVNAGVVGAEDAELQWGDYNADGAPDLAVMGSDPTSSGDQTTIYRNDGGGTFTDIGAGLPGLVDGDLDWGDYDNDGDLDLAVVGEGSSGNVTTIYENQGSDSFAPLNAGLTGVGNESALDWGDYDGDGRLDLVVTGEDGSFDRRTILYRNQGGGSFVAVNNRIVNASRGSVDWGDYDGDGALDLLLTGEVPTESETTASIAFLYQSEPNPPPPPLVSARPAENQETRVQWDSSRAGDISEYHVYRATASITSSPSGLTPYDTVSAPTRTYADTAVTTNTTYYYRLTAVDTTGAESGTFSPEATAEPKPTAATLYVDQGASGANDGSSWNDAFVHLQDAADSVNANPYTDYDIRVAEGVYYPDEDKDGDHVADDTLEAFRIQVDDVTLEGGYPSGGGTRDPDNNVTVLSGDITQDDSTTSTGVTGSPSGINGDNAVTVLLLDGTVLNDPGAISETIRQNTIVDGITITGGYARGSGLKLLGGGLLCNGSGTGNECSPVIRQVTFRGNAAQFFGGGMIAWGREGRSSPTVEGVLFRSNRADLGGGAFVTGEIGGESLSTFRDITFRANNARSGGAVYVSGEQDGLSSPLFQNTTFQNNQADEAGGAVVIDANPGGESNSRFKRTAFRGNRASRGGAVFINAEQQGRIETAFINTIFRDNESSSGGGGVYSIGRDDGVLHPHFANTLFRNNHAGGDGGAVLNHGESGATINPTFTNVTFANNQADVVGGAVYNEASAGTVTPQYANAILWANEAGTGGDEVVNNDATSTFTHSLVEGSGGSGSGWDASLGTDDGGNIDRDPLFVDTSAVDLRPQEDSPVLDAGLNSALPSDSTDLDADGDSTEALPLDLADSTRVADNNGDGTATVNMGAYEAVGPDLTPLAAPDTAAITAFTDSLRVGWTAITDGDLVRYRIYRDTTSIDSTAGPGALAPYDSVSAGTEVFTDTSVAPDSTYFYRVTAVDDAGNESSFSVEAQARPATALTVWPGDTNSDGVVNQNDVLPLGFQWNQTGPARDSTGCAFEGRAAPAWPTQAATYADANGDGVVDQNDVLCIGLNWGDSTGTSQQAAALYAASSKAGTEPSNPAVSDERPVLDREQVSEGTNVSADAVPSDRTAPEKRASEQAASSGQGRLELKAPTEPDSVLWVEVRAKDMTDVGGAAFEVTFPNSKATVEDVIGQDWFGEETLFQSRIDEETGVVGVGLVHPDSARSGSGVLARLKVRLGADVTDAVPLQLRNAKAGRASGTMMSLDTGAGVDVRRVPENFKLYSNYPNPVQQRTTIRYDLPSERRVELRVYDVLGRHVTTLVDDTQKPGQKSVTWEVDEMASGVYVYRLTAGDQSETGKITVVR